MHSLVGSISHSSDLDKDLLEQVVIRWLDIWHWDQTWEDLIRAVARTGKRDMAAKLASDVGVNLPSEGYFF